MAYNCKLCPRYLLDFHLTRKTFSEGSRLALHFNLSHDMYHGYTGRILPVLKGTGTFGKRIKRVFGENHEASIRANEKNGWKATPASFLEYVPKACVEHGHGGLCNAAGYDVKNVLLYKSQWYTEW